jgi:hypothetical protein
MRLPHTRPDFVELTFTFLVDSLKVTTLVRLESPAPLSLNAI